MKLVPIISIAAGICTAIAGLLHLSMIPAQSTNSTILFLIGGIAQVFWIIPTVKRSGMIWDAVGIGGTLIFIQIWTITRVPDNPITGRGGRIGDTAIIIEVFQIVFVILLGILISKKKSFLDRKNID